MIKDYKITTAAATNPITTAEVKSHLNIDHTDDDTYLDTLIAAATDHCENYTLRSFVTRTYTGTLAAFTNEILLPRPNGLTVTSVKYYDEDNAQQTLATSVYGTDFTQEPALIYLKDGQSWPALYDRPNPIEVIWTAGYGAASAVPEGIKVIIKLLVGEWYKNRESGSSSKTSTHVLNNLLDKYSMREF